MNKNLKFEKYNEEKEMVDFMLELFLHTLIPLIAQLLAGHLILIHFDLNEYVHVGILILIIIVTFLFSVFVLSPLITRIKFNKLYKLNKFFKSTDIYAIRNEFLKNGTEYLKKNLDKMNIENYQFIISELKKHPDQEKMKMDKFIFNISSVNGKITNIPAEFQWGTGKLNSYNIEIDKEHGVLLVNFTFIYELNSESLANNEIKHLHNKNGYNQIFFDYKNNKILSCYFFDNIEEPNNSELSIVTFEEK